MNTPPPLLHGFNPTLLLVLNLTGTFVFGLSGGMAGVRADLDLFGAVVLGIAGGAGLLTSVAREPIARFQHPIDALDAAGLALFCVTGAATALAHRLGTPEAIILGAVTGIGGGMLRDILIREIPTVLRGGLYAIPALVGAGIVVVTYRAGDHTVTFPIVGAVVCFAMRMTGLRFGIGLPSAAKVTVPTVPRRRPQKKTNG